MEHLKRLAWQAERKKLQIYLVGGYMRDLLSEKNSTDLDLTGPVGTLSLAHDFARENNLPAHLVARHGLLRINLGDINLDISEFKGRTLLDDLSRRDFTVNAMAYPLHLYVEGAAIEQFLIDPFAGYRDLVERKLEALPASLQHDPLRILRGARVALQYELIPTTDTIEDANSFASTLADVPGERILAEIFSVLRSDCAGYLPVMQTLGACRYVFGKEFIAKSDFFTIQAQRMLLKNSWPASLWKNLQPNLHRKLSARNRAIDFVKLTALFGDLNGIVAPVSAQTLSHFSKLPLAKDEKSCLAAQGAALSWLLYHYKREKLGKEPIYDLYHSYGQAGIDALVLLPAVSDPSSFNLANSLLGVLLDRKNRLVSPPELLTGGELAAMIGRQGQPSARTGLLKSALFKAAALQKITNRAEAVAFARGFVAAYEKNFVAK